MARPIDDINRAIMRVRDLPFGSARNEVASALVREVSTDGPQEARAFALFALTESYVFSTEVEKAYLPFTQSVRLWDEHPELFDEQDVHSLFWSFKWMVGNLMEFPTIPADQITSTLDDMGRRYRLAGNGLSAVNHLTFQWHHLLGDEELPAAYERWITTERDDFSQCPACEPGDRTAYLFEVGRFEEGIRLLESAEEGAAACHSEPADRLSQLQLAYLEVGDADGAARAHRQGVRGLESSGELAGAQGRHVQMLARSGNHAAAHRFLEKSAALLLSAETPSDRLSFLTAAGTGVSVLRTYEPHRAVLLDGVPATTVAELDDWMHDEALALAAAFDARGGTSASVDRVHRAWSGTHSELPVDLSVLGDLARGVAAPGDAAPRTSETLVPGAGSGPDGVSSAGDHGETARPDAAGPERAGVGPDALVSAAEAAVSRDESIEAARLYVQAAEMFDSAAEPEAAGFALAEAAAICAVVGDEDGAVHAYRSALGRLGEAGTGIEFTGPVTRAYARVCATTGSVETAVEVLTTAAGTAEVESAAARGAVHAVGEPLDATMAEELAARRHHLTVLAAEHAHLLDTLARSHASAGNATEAVAEARRAAECFAELSMTSDAAHAFWLTGRLERDAGRLDEAAWLLESAVEGFTIVRATTPRTEVTGELVQVLTELGRTDEADQLVRRLAG